MNEVVAKVRGFVERHAMLDGACRILVGVSGGADSIALLDLLVHLLAEPDRKKGASSRPPSAAAIPPSRPLLHVAHLDHMLRGAESAADAEFVRTLAGRIGIPVTIHKFDVGGAAERARRGIEDTAREVRYAFLLAAAERLGCQYIAVGHTKTDQAETFLMRLARGAGLRGLGAMRAVAPVPAFEILATSPESAAAVEEWGSLDLPLASNSGPLRGSAEASASDPILRQVRGAAAPPERPLLIRPLLCITREEVEEYCRERGLPYRIDATNLTLDYTRNQVRRIVLPALRQINPQIVERIAQTTEIIGADDHALDDVARNLLDQAAILHSSADAPASRAAYPLAALLSQPLGLRRRMIMEAVRRARRASARQDSVSEAGKNTEPPDQNRLHAPEISAIHIDQVAGLVERGASGKRITLPGGVVAWREFDLLVLDSEARLAPAATGEPELGPEHPVVNANGFRISLERNLRGSLLTSLRAQMRRDGERGGRDWMSVALDDDALPAALVVRTRRKGERAHVLGQAGIKKLKNLMIAHRIPTSRRNMWPIVTTPDGRYIWSPGLPPSIEFAALDETHGLAILRASAILAAGAEDRVFEDQKNGK